MTAPTAAPRQNVAQISRNKKPKVPKNSRPRKPRLGAGLRGAGFAEVGFAGVGFGAAEREAA
jgi:hypothetical protein